MRRDSTVPAWTKSAARMPRAWAVRNCFHGRPGTPGRWLDSGVVQDLPDGGGGDRVAEPSQFALDARWPQAGLSVAMRMTGFGARLP
jgi:hypothetical protein